MIQFSKSIETAVANYYGAMETRDHFKNGAKPKTLTSRKISNWVQITIFTVAFTLILSGCTYDTEKKLHSNSTVTAYFTHEEINDLTKLLDFFNEQICISNGIEKKEIIKCYDSFFKKMLETVEAGNLETKISFAKQKEIYNQISDSLFNQIWAYSKSWKRDSSDSLKFIDFKIGSKYVKFLKELGKEYEMVKNYSETFGIAGGISPSMVEEILMTKERYQYDLNDVRLQLVVAIHYLTINYKEKYSSVAEKL